MSDNQTEPSRLRARLTELHREIAQIQRALSAPKNRPHQGPSAVRDVEEPTLDPHESLVKLLPQFVVIHQDGVVVYANEFVAHSLGFESAAELLGQPVIDFVHPEDRPQVVERVGRLLQGGPPAPPLVERIRRRDGSFLEAEITGALILWNGRPAVQVVARDISESLKARRAIEHLMTGTASTGSDFFHDLTRSLGEILGLAHIFVVEWDPESDQLMTLSHWHKGQELPPASYQRKGTPCEITLQDGLYCCPTNAQALFPDAIDLKALGGESYLGVAIHNQHGEKIGSLCVLDSQPLLNVDWLLPVLQAFALRAGAEFDRVRHERELAASEKRFRALFENSHDALLVIDPESLRVLMVNRQAEQLFADSAGNVLQPGRWALATNLLLDGTAGCLEAVLAAAASADSEGVAVRHGQVLLRRADHTSVPCELSASRITIDAKVHVLVQLRDVREQYEAEQLSRLQNSVLETIAEGAELSDTLDLLCREVESIMDGGLASVMLMDRQAGALRLFVGPSLPPKAFEMLAHLPVSATGGSCSAAVYFGKKTVVADTLEDSRWRDAQWLVEALGIRACWSIPFLIDGEVAGTFAISLLQSREPSNFENRIFESAAHLASIAVQRDRSYRQLAQQEQQLRGVLQTATDFIWSLDAPGRVRYYNRSLNGESPRIGAPLVAFLPDTWKNPMQRAMQHVARTRLPYQFDVKLDREQDPRWFSVRVGPVETAGQFDGFTICASETTSRKKMEEELRFNLDRFRALAESAPAVIYLSDRHGELSYVNSHWTVLTGQDRWSWRQPKALWTMISESDAERVESLWESCRTQVKRFEAEYQVVGGEDEIRFLYHVAEPLRSADGGCTGFVGFILDVTPIVESASKLRQRESELAHVSRLATMGQLVAELSHEINQPLYAISNYAAALRQQLATSGVPDNETGPLEWADRIGRIAADAGEIIKRLRTFTTQPETTFAEFDLADAVGEAVSLLEWHLRANNIALLLEAPDVATVVCGDRVAIQQVIVNLIKNAAEALQTIESKNKQVVVRILATGEDIHVQVVDNGPGVPHVERADDLFRAFTSYKRGGSGMGLAVSRSIVERHHGQLQYQPNTPRGAVFSFSIPRYPDALTRRRG